MNNGKLPVMIVAFFMALVGISGEAMAGEAGLNVDANGVFIDGYDVVAYSTAAEAVKGADQYSTEYKGAKLYFSSNENLEAFKSDPEKYMPKYNGFCAFAVANGKGLVKANPKTFKFYNGELLMFFDDIYEGSRFNTIVPWNADERALHAKADENWGGLNK